ncbi:tensin-1-like isoform X3 [Ostrea edulis]|uniref:tensin-1-like isoform X3 n=1 Tax=Ostrea edulis TaxID=37623 RepID=UPI002094343C|nr:tensin-1-like isoform X3 [Ostrea edulis]XP_056010149.1 tensin-1-like isoform X3 [Ostrea edulis]XP_056010150.1 tensin-1-like isoform X3 [Ostrea edulis]
MRWFDEPMKMEEAQIELVYVTDRIICMSFLSEGHNVEYQRDLQDVFHMLRAKHGENVLVINISEPRDDLQRANNQKVIDFGWPEHLAPPLERLCNICKSLDSWLNSDLSHVIVLHCKGGRGRLAVIIAAFLNYSNICSSSEQLLDRMAINRFYEDKLGGLKNPSHRRYIEYFSGLLSGAIKINSNPLYLHHLVMHGVPNFDSRGGCRPFITVYQSMQPVFTSGVYNVTDQMQKVCISISPGIPLRGDIMINCYHRANSGHKDPIWKCQFHTCAISNYNLLFSKEDLDDAERDPRFPDNGKIEFVFGPNQDAVVPVTDFKSDVTVPVEDNADELGGQESRYIDGYSKIENVLRKDEQSSSYSMDTKRMQNSNNNTKSYGSQSYNTSYSTNAKQSVTPLDEQTQLDDILSNLLNDQVISPKSGSSTMSKETRTFRTFETHTGPDGKMAHQSAEVTYKLPGEVKEERHYTVKTEKSSSPYMPTKAFSYTTSPEMARKFDSPKSNTLPYKTDYDNRYQSDMSSSYSTMQNGKMVPESDSWLQQQQKKLRDKKDYKDDVRVQQEKKLVEELRSAQNRYMTKRAQSEEEAACVKNSSLSNGPASAPPQGYSYSMSRTHTYSTEKPPGTFSSGDSTFDSRVTKPTSPTRGLQTKVILQPASAPISPPLRSSSKNFMQRSRTLSNSAVDGKGPQKLLRQSSDVTFDRKDDIQPPVIRQITITTPPRSPRPFSPTYQTSTYRYSNRSAASLSPPVERKTFQREFMTPPVQEPTVMRHTNQRSFSSSESDKYNTKSLPRHAATKSKVTEIHESSLPEGTVEKSYKTDRDLLESNKLDDLQQSLSAVNNTVLNQQPQQTTGGYTQEHVVTRRMETRKYETNYQQQQEQQMPNTVAGQSYATTPKTSRTVEEDRFSLRPIGPGMQPLEPEGSPTNVGTLNRSTTPSFPTATTPSFPVTPGMYTDNSHQMMQREQQSQNQTMERQHFQYQQNYQTSHQQQSYQTNHQQHQQHQQQYLTEDQQHMGTRSPLHIDTSSPPMLSTGIGSRSPASPHSPETLNTLRHQLHVANNNVSQSAALSPNTVTGQSSPSVYFGLSRRGSLSSVADSVDATHATPKFVKDTSKFWYKPNISREEAIQLLKDKPPGTFVVRDSNSFPGAFGLALKVATVPANVQTKSSGDPSVDLVRHFLIEPTPKGVRLRGCNNEPVFGSLASLVYQHSLTPLALPCKLALPEPDTIHDHVDGPTSPDIPSSAAALLAQGAACNVLYLNSVDTESLTGPQAVAKAIKQTFDGNHKPKQTVVHFKVSNQGITLTDNQRKLFFRRHYPVSSVTYCGMDPEGKQIFGFVAKKQSGGNDNTCHLFAELDPGQPASAIVNFVTKVMIGQGKKD